LITFLECFFSCLYVSPLSLSPFSLYLFPIKISSSFTSPLFLCHWLPFILIVVSAIFSLSYFICFNIKCLSLCSPSLSIYCYSFPFVSSSLFLSKNVYRVDSRLVSFPISLNQDSTWCLHLRFRGF
jgi:hypothetical protein